MKNISEPFLELTQEFKQYLNLKIALVSLSLSRKFSQLFGMLLSALIFVGLLSVILLMLTFAFVFWYGGNIGTLYQGFLIASLFYMLVALLVYVFRKKLFIDPMIRLLNDKIGDELHEDSLFAEISNSRDLKLQTELLQFKLLQSEQQMQQQFVMLSQGLNPFNMVKNLLGNSVSTAAISMAILEAVISWLRKRKTQSRQADNESDS